MIIIATNEELVAAIQAGDFEKMPQLWEQIKRLIKLNALYYLDSCGPVVACRTTPEDLVQCGYFAVLSAIADYKPESGYKFTTYMRYTLKNEFRKECGLVIRKVDGKYKDVSIKPVSLNAPMTDEEDGDEFGEIIPDKRAEFEFEQVERQIYNEQLKAAIDKAMMSLPKRQEIVLRHRYYDNMTCAAIGAELGCTGQSVSLLEDKALKTLRMKSAENRLDQYLDMKTNFYKGTGLHAFKNSGISPVERLAMQREKLAKAWVLEHCDI